MIDADGESKITNQNIDKMGPIQLRIEEGTLYSSWEASRRSEVDGFKGDKEGQKKVLETWVCRPPNVLMFQLNRVGYDFKESKLIKDNSRFEFDQTIYLDLFLNQNRDRAETHRLELEQMKLDLKVMQDTYAQYSASAGPGKQMGNLVDMFLSCENVLHGERTLIDTGAGK